MFLVLLKSRPCCENNVMMVIPFFTIVCCAVSMSSNIVFDDTTSTLTVTSWPGYFFCCKFKNCYRIEYETIANVGLFVTSTKQNDQYKYKPGIVLKTSEYVVVGEARIPEKWEHYVLSLHYHIFGRGNANYESPHYPSLWVLHGSRFQKL